MLVQWIFEFYYSYQFQLLSNTQRTHIYMSTNQSQSQSVVQWVLYPESSFFACFVIFFVNHFNINIGTYLYAIDHMNGAAPPTPLTTIKNLHHQQQLSHPENVKLRLLHKQHDLFNINKYQQPLISTYLVKISSRFKPLRSINQTSSVLKVLGIVSIRVLVFFNYTWYVSSIMLIELIKVCVV